MKARMLSFAIALLVLFSFSNAFGQNCHQVGKLRVTAVNGDDIALSGKIAGLGNVNELVKYSLTGTISGVFECVPPGQKKRDPGSVAPGHTSFTYSGSGEGYPTNGNLLFSVYQDSECNEQFGLRISNASFTGTITIFYSDGTTVYCEADLSL